MTSLRVALFLRRIGGWQTYRRIVGSAFRRYYKSVATALCASWVLMIRALNRPQGGGYRNR